MFRGMHTMFCSSRVELSRRASSLLVLLLVAPAGSAIARNLVDAPPIDYFPLRIDTDTLKRDGKKVSFSYIIDVPRSLEGRKDAEGARGSNEVETTIDCDAETYTLGKVTVYRRAKGEGEVENVLPAAVDNRPLRIYPNSTAGYLADHVCK